MNSNQFSLSWIRQAYFFTGISSGKSTTTIVTIRWPLDVEDKSAALTSRGSFWEETGFYYKCSTDVPRTSHFSISGIVYVCDMFHSLFIWFTKYIVYRHPKELSFNERYYLQTVYSFILGLYMLERGLSNHLGKQSSLKARKIKGANTRGLQCWSLWKV